MKRGVKAVAAIMVAIVMAFGLSACRQAERVSYNLSKEADAFNVVRRVTVFNMRSDKVLLEVIGRLSVQSSNGDIDIIVEVGHDHYKKHFVGLNEWTTYVVEDIDGAYVDPYHYEINFQPEMVVPITITMSD